MGKIKSTKKLLKMNYQTAKQIDIISYLSKQGFYTEKIRGNNAWYLSPFKNERTASFKVDISKNLFFDFSTGIGGTIIDLIMNLHNCTSFEALQKLSNNDHLSFHQPHIVIEKRKPYAITKVTELEHPKVLAYLQNRKFNLDFAKQFCKEVHYTFDHQKIYQGVGFKNDSGGFEIRYHNFKCCLVKKNITTIVNHSKTACFFESWSDFLSYLTLKKRIPKEDFIILNSTALVKKTEYLLSNYKRLKVFFDADMAGRAAYNYIEALAPKKAVDCSIHYSDYNDLNDYLINSETIRR